MNKRYLIDLTEDERTFLLAITSKGKASARKIKRANLLLMADRKQHTEKQITELLGVSSSTIYRTKRDFVEEGLERALEEGSRSGQPEKTQCQ